MRLDNIQIANGKQLKEHFDFKSIWGKIGVFTADLRDVALIGRPGKERLLGLIEACAGDLEALPAQAADLGLDFTRENDPNLPGACWSAACGSGADQGAFEAFRAAWEPCLRELYLGFFEEKQLSQNRRRNAFLIVFAVHYLADVEIVGIPEIVGLFRAPAGAAAPKGAGVVPDLAASPVVELWNSDEPYLLRQYDFSAGDRYRIETRRLVNVSESRYGKALLCVTGENDAVLLRFELAAGESVYVSTINGQFLQRVPNLSAGGSHCVYRTQRNGAAQLRRFVYAEHDSTAFDTRSYPGIAQFCADDADGFVGLCGGAAVPYSEIESFSEIPDGSRYVWVSVLGSQYAALTENGKIVSNFLPLVGWENMLTIAFTEENEACGIDAAGRLRSTKNGFSPPAGGGLTDFSLCGGAFLARRRSGELLCAGCRPPEGANRFWLGSGGTVFLDEASTLWTDGRRVAEDVADAAPANGRLAVLYRSGKAAVYDFASGLLQGE